ncbi:serine acetyltransferase [Bifidobacterium lemurum]|uniref:Serine acetyltransferase n=1 Tax=Bifidobacterium lemurum TaxID=1603886 RepID=A0A261FQU1_9BIFI|nr:serine acetyltransferase [Bifidobacterium lemurum]OZG61333.1 serine acetyltransferase [Bifidobacterium lemurum]QOL34721.1 serine acetyltransferase [Bifidobacterium lemurum]
MTRANTLIATDCRQYLGRDGSHLKLRLEQQGFRYTSVLRKAQACPRGVLHYWYRFRLLRLSIKTGFQIGYGATIGAGLFIGHRGTVIVNGEARLGSNVNLSPGVVIGQENRGSNVGVPHLGNRVWIGSNAVLVGGIRIGNDVLIAPNAYVNFDVPDHSIVIGNPARIIHRDNATAGYCHNLVENLVPDEDYSVAVGGRR